MKDRETRQPNSEHGSTKLEKLLPKYLSKAGEKIKKIARNAVTTYNNGGEKAVNNMIEGALPVTLFMKRK